MKVCTHNRCSNEHETKFKLCPTCRNGMCVKIRERRAKMNAKTCREGYRVCIECSYEKPEDQFMSPVYRRDKLTRRCQYCRTQRKKHDKDPKNKSGRCYVWWQEWKKNHPCIDCGLEDYRVIQADHVRDKKGIVSNYRYWANNGGVEAMKMEAEKCEARCNFCHRLKTRERHQNKRKRTGWSTRPSIKRRRHQVNMKKCEIGKCKTCKREVTYDTTSAFDFDHRDEETKIINISTSISRSDDVFQRHFREEIPKCDLLCANCHHIKTHYLKT